jgi:Protein of unknown function (DUF1360)
MPTWALVLLAAPACYRYTWFVTKDDLPSPVRAWLVKRGPGWLGELLTCHFCASGWVAIALTALVYLAPGVAEPVVVTGAVWAAGTAFAELHDRTG